MSSAKPNLYETLGGEAALRPIIEDFVQQVTTDAMIGFFFDGVDRKKLADLEFSFTARMLGASMPYEGRTMRAAHARHPIMGGQFDRRRRILQDCIERHGVCEEIKEVWLKHVDKLRSQITSDARGDCQTPGDVEAKPKQSFGIIT